MGRTFGTEVVGSMGSETPSLMGVAYSELPFLSRDLADTRSEMLGLFGGPLGSLALGVLTLLPLWAGCLLKQIK